MEKQISNFDESIISNSNLINSPAFQKNIVYKNGLFYKSRLNWTEMSDREIKCNTGLAELPDNKISTSKYTIFTFIPKNLLFQFMKLANLYFLFIGVMQAINVISISGGRPVIYLPLSVIITITAVKDLFEDLKRHKSDNEENNRSVSVIRNGAFMEASWKDLRVGEIIKIKKNQYFPADVLLMYSSESKGSCFIETKNLDGETNLKHKNACKEIAKEINNEKDLFHQNFILSYEKPNPYLYTFSGTVILNDGTKIACDAQNFVLRGCSLRNTEFIYGLIAYSGHDTKIMLNSVKSRPKQSKLEKSMNREIMIVFILQLIICFFVSLFYSLSYKNLKDNFSYLEIDDNSSFDNSIGYNLFVRFGNWILIFTNFVPISLLVSLEMVKFIQGIMISRDEKLKCIKENEYVNVQSSNLNEELGQVEYIFSDKTGTLTCNIMEFRNLCINRSAFGDDESSNIDLRPKVTNVNFKDENFFRTLNDNTNKDYNATRKFLEMLSICHTVIVENKKDEICYNASSPDELALINFARFCGFEYQGLDENNNMIVDMLGTTQKYLLMHVLEFNSSRKRMSIIYKDNKGRIYISSKGADSILLERMNKNNPYIIETWRNLEKFAEKGLRTLIICQREITYKEYDNWQKRYHEACTSITDREQKMGEIQEEIERDLELVGATAIEDKLQDEVGLTIATLKETGIKVWVLTGDKIETAINIGFSCNLLNNNLEQMIIDGKTEEDISLKISENLKKIRKNLSYALIVSGDALIHALKPDISSKLMELASVCEAVLCCRVSPKQKQEVVTLVRQERPKVTTLAIGDGANDVNMITAAHVGVGIKGVEGQQAARSSDYAIGEFKILRRLLLYHGREAYRRNSVLICYNFYKNVILVLPQFWFGIFNFFSGQTLYDSYLYQLFNLFYASMPIVVYAIYDQEYSDNFLDKAPSAYKNGIKGTSFTKSLFWIRWIFVGVIQALLITLFSFYSLCLNFTSKKGSNLGFWDAGITAFGQCVLIANIKVCLFTCSYSKISLFFLIGSYLIYIISFAIVNKIDSSEIFNDFNPINQTSNYHLINMLVVFTLCGLDFALTRYELFIRKMNENIKISDLFNENKKLNNDLFNEIHYNQDQGQEINHRDELIDKMMIKSKHTGYAFSQEELIDQVEAKRFRF